MGRLDLAKISPFPEQKAEDRDQGDAFLQRLDKFLREKVDPDAVGEIKVRGHVARVTARLRPPLRVGQSKLHPPSVGSVQL